MSFIVGLSCCTVCTSETVPNFKWLVFVHCATDGEKFVAADEPRNECLHVTAINRSMVLTPIAFFFSFFFYFLKLGTGKLRELSDDS